MRTLLLCAAYLLFTGAMAQKVMRLDSARTKGLTTAHMDSLYLSAFDVTDSSKSAFPGRTDEFIEQFQRTLQEMGGHLGKEGFKWGTDTRMTYRMFFAADGRLEHFHYHLKEPMPAEHELEFQQKLESFMAQYRFPMQAGVPFKQCGTAVFKDK